MRRYRMINGTFDTRSHLIVDEISADWEPGIRAQHWFNRLRALEWLLNHLIHEFRDDFKGTPQYKHVFDKESFDDWSKAIDVLQSWDILLPEVVSEYRELRTKRNQSIHFRPETSTRSREMALNAIQLLGRIIEGQFGSLGAKPWYFQLPGETYIKKAAEAWPFVQKILVPAGLHVGPKYTLSYDQESGSWSIEDVGDAGPDEGTDEDFASLRTGRPTPESG